MSDLLNCFCCELLNCIITIVFASDFYGLVNNAGVSVKGDIEVLSLESIQRVHDVNFMGMVRVTKVLLPLLRKNKGNRSFSYST